MMENSREETALPSNLQYIQRNTNSKHQEALYHSKSQREAQTVLNSFPSALILFRTARLCDPSGQAGTTKH